jgi:ABC-2 type transport system ATP-binding protein
MQLTINNLSKEYPNGVKALNNLSLEIQNGMFGLLGPNGAGKSTLMRIIATLQDADSGQIHLDDMDVLNQKQEVKKTLGYLPQEFGVYSGVSAERMLKHFANLKGIEGSKNKIVKGLLERVNLYDHRKKSVHTYSGGMKQRLGIALALLGDPKLIIVDEPTAGLDPAERVRFNNLLSDISEDKIVILSTHIVEDVSDLCSQTAIINKGEVLVQGNPSELLQKMEGKIWEKKIAKTAYDEYAQKYHVVYTRLLEGQPLIHVFDEQKPEDGFELVKPTLEDVYFTTIQN